MKKFSLMMIVALVLGFSNAALATESSTAGQNPGTECSGTNGRTNKPGNATADGSTPAPTDTSSSAGKAQ